MNENQQIMVALEQLKQQLLHIESQVESEKGTRRRMTRFVLQEVEKLKQQLIGGEESIFIRVDRVERTVAGYERVKWAAIGAWVSIVGKIVYDFFIHTTGR